VTLSFSGIKPETCHGKLMDTVENVRVAKVTQMSGTKNTADRALRTRFFEELYNANGVVVSLHVPNETGSVPVLVVETPLADMVGTAI